MAETLARARDVGGAFTGLTGDSGPVWYRGFSQQAEEKVCDALRATLQAVVQGCSELVRDLRCHRQHLLHHLHVLPHAFGFRLQQRQTEIHPGLWVLRVELHGEAG